MKDSSVNELLLQRKIHGLKFKKEEGKGAATIPKATTTTTGKERDLSSSSSSSSSPDRILHVVAEVNKRLQQLNGMCVQKHEGWWSYEWCHHQSVAQFHIHMIMDHPNPGPGAAKATANNHNNNGVQLQDVTKLGKFTERKVIMMESGDDDDNNSKQQQQTTYQYAEGEQELARVVDTYLEGDMCPATGRPRMTQVTLRCCSPRVMNKIKESK